ncbi:MAG TPA: DUF2207 domain-containing protein [Pseudolysinimonas sp.]|jgi:uncharacterized membrane protein YgcG|nr:DUF2207 domain-containing protein [Pseudolysinimonas sp.]
MPRTRRLLAAVAALALVSLPALPAIASEAQPQRAGWAALPGDVSDFEFRSFDAAYALSRTADRRAALDVVETAVAVFPSSDQNHGLLRSIPDYYGDVNLGTQVLAVTDENGTALPYTDYTDGGFTIVQIGDADTYVHGVQTYVIHYTQTDTIRYFPDTDDDEFYWDVNGTGWQQPFGEVTATLTLDDPDLIAALSGQNACYQGPENAGDPCSRGIAPAPSPAGTAVITAGADDLAPGENLTMVVGFAAHTFVEGTPDPNGNPYEPGVPVTPVDLGPAPSPWAVLLGLGGGGVAVVLGVVAAAVLRRPLVKPTGFIVPQYSAPKGLDIMIAAQFIERGSTALQAQLVSLAVKRKIRLLGYPVQDAASADYAVQLVDPTGLESWEQAVVDALFGPGAEPGAARDLQRDGDSDLAAALRPLVAALPSAVVQSGFHGGRVATPGGRWFLIGSIAATVLGLVGAALSSWLGFLIGPFTFIAGLVGIGIAAFGARKRTTLSQHGAETMDYLLGMKMYLDLAEKDRFAYLQSATGAERIDTTDGRQVVKLYEKLLPWAVIWGVEESWARELEVHLQETGIQPDWYAGQGLFQAYAFSSLLSGLSTGTSAPAPVSTSGSSWSGSGFSSFSGGSSGGGFSGGGGGGGGGGGW